MFVVLLVALLAAFRLAISRDRFARSFSDSENAEEGNF